MRPEWEATCYLNAKAKIKTKKKKKQKNKKKNYVLKCIHIELLYKF